MTYPAARNMHGPQQIARLPKVNVGDRVRLRGTRKERTVRQLCAALTEDQPRVVWKVITDMGEVWDAGSVVPARTQPDAAAPPPTEEQKILNALDAAGVPSKGFTLAQRVAILVSWKDKR